MKEKMIAARDLIKAKRYADAYAILQTVDHPLAREWMTKLDDLMWQLPSEPEPAAPPKQPDPFMTLSKPLPSLDKPLAPKHEPWNPWNVGGYFLMFSPAITGLLLPFNWRRLGKPDWMWTALLVHVMTFVSFILFVVLGATRKVTVGGIPTPSVPMIVTACAFMGLLFGSYVADASLQYGAYKKWQKTNDMRQVVDHHYPVLQIVTICMIPATLLGAAAGFYMYETGLKPHTFDNRYLSINYPGSWDVANLNNYDACTQPDAAFTCLTVLVDPGPYYGTTLMVIHWQLDYPMTAEEVEESSWNNPGWGDFGTEARQLETDTVDGLKATVRIYEPYNEDNPDTPFFVRQLYIVDGTSVYELTISTGCSGCYYEHEDTINAVLHSIDFKPVVESGQA